MKELDFKDFSCMQSCGLNTLSSTKRQNYEKEILPRKQSTKKGSNSKLAEERSTLPTTRFDNLRTLSRTIENYTRDCYCNFSRSSKAKWLMQILLQSPRKHVQYTPKPYFSFPKQHFTPVFPLANVNQSQRQLLGPCILSRQIPRP